MLKLLTAFCLLFEILQNVSGEFLLIADTYPGRLLKLDLINMNLTQIPISGVEFPISITYDPVTERVIWADYNLQQIASSRMDGSDPIVLLRNDSISEIQGMEIDTVNRYLFYTDTGNDLIGRVSLDGNVTETIISANLTEPRGIVSVPDKKLIFWTDWGDIDRIERSTYDGLDRQTIATENLVWPNAVKLDKEDDVLYFCDAYTEKIEKMNFDGGQRQVVANISGTHCRDISRIGRDIYFTDWSASYLQKLNIDGTVESVTSVPLQKGRGIHFVDDIDGCGNNPCQNNGRCTDLFNDYKCSCAAGFYGTNCEIATGVSWCHPDTGSMGPRTRCSQIPGFSEYQTATCMSISQLQSTAPHVQCADSCRSYCILSCMAEKHSEHSGAVSSDCVCDPGQTTDAGTGIPSWCFYTQGECDFFSTCLQSRHTNCTMETDGLTTQCNWLTDALNDFSNCSTKEWLRKVRFCFQAYFISSLDIEANTTCSELTDMMNYESYGQCLRLTTADNLDFCDLDDDDKAKIRSSFISTFSDELQRNIDPTLCWMDC